MTRFALLVHRAIVVLSFTVLARGASGSEPEKQVPSPAVYVKAGHLFDATSNNVRENVIVEIQGERIAKIGPAAQIAIPAGAEIVDLSQAWVLPGLIDCHTHLSFRADQYNPINQVKLGPFVYGFYSVVNADRTLQAGFTSVRDVGSPPFLAVDLRRTIDEGFIPGPRIVASGPALSITGGHGDMNGFAPAVSNMMYPAERDFSIVDSPDEVRHAVRAQIKYGVDVIKILATGGVLSQGDKPGAEQLTYDEMKVA
ncbi:MAG TPA: amidohydrolase family protein, partial [Terracidiphilus sp.]|nr:amidohydrolase family protein [Terracidiphilus sp.]